MSSRRPAAAGVAAIGALVAFVVACSTTPQPSPSTGPLSATATPGAPAATDLGATFDPDATAPPIAFQGLYVGNDVSVTGDATVAVVRSGMPCSALEHLIGAGEWTIVGREVQGTGSGADEAILTILTLQNGDDTAQAWIAGGDTCTARIARTTSATLRVSGAATFDGSAAMDQPFCVATGRSVVLGLTYRAPTGPNVQVSIVAPALVGSTRLNPDDVTVNVARGSMSLARVAGILIHGLQDVEKGSFPEAYLPTEDSKVTLELESIDPFSGTLHVTDFEGAAGPIDLETDVDCHLPGGGLRRLAEAAAVPPPTVPPGTPGPTLAPFAGAAPGTLVATGGEVAGTYSMPSSRLDCYFDVEEGAWSISTTGTADPTFYAYVFVGQGGGSTDRVSLGLIVGDGSNGRIATVETRLSPPDGAADAQVTISGGIVTLVAQARTSAGVTLAANLSCAGS